MRAPRPIPRLLVGLVVSAAALGTHASAAPADKKEATMKVRIVIDEDVLHATLGNSPAAKDFAKLLPLELMLRDYAGTEKVSDLPSRLSTKGEPPGFDPDVGDIAYYAPWGNLAIFYRDARHADGLVRLGRIEADVAKLGRRQGDTAIRIEREDVSP